MRTRIIIFVFGLAVCAMGGCAPVTSRFPLWHDMARSQPTHSPTASFSAPPLETTLSPALLALIREQDKQEENLFDPISLPTNDLQEKTPETKPQRSENVVKQPAVSERPASASQKAPGPRADDQLLDLLQKDLDRAIEQTPERRQLQFSKAVTENPKVRYYIDYFSRNGKNHFQTALARSGKYMPMIAKVLRDEGLPEEFAYLALIESGFLMDTSSSGASGIWQLVPATARRYGLKIDPWIDERRDAAKATRAAAAHLKELHIYYGRWYLATAAYNAGQATIDRATQASGAKDFRKLTENIALKEETRNFVPKFVAAAIIAANPKKYGFGNLRNEAPLEYEEVEVTEGMKLEALAEMANTTAKTLQELNPELLTTQLPPGDRTFRLKVPTGQATLLAAALNEIKESAPLRVVTHNVEKGETLFSIARYYGQTVKALMELNGLTTPKLKIGQQLKVIVETVRGVIR
jgi:membrane-bound lytic murein transglycosylase D